MRVTGVLAIAVLAVPGSAVVAAPAVAATPVTCGATVTGAAVLTADLTCAGDGVTLAGDATLDLRGHTLAGPGRTTATTGITVTGIGDARVVGGRLSGWGTGVGERAVEDPDEVSTLTADRVTFSGNGTAVNAAGSVPYGSRNRTYDVRRGAFTGNDRGISALFTRVRVRQAAFDRNGTAASVIAGGLDVAASAFTRNRKAVECDESGCALTRNVLAGNATTVTSMFFSDVTLTENTVSGSDVGYATIDPFGPGTLTRNVFAGNTVAVRIGEGRVTATGNVFTGNRRAVVADGTAPDELSRADLVGNRFTRNGDAVDLLIAASLKDNSATRNTGWGLHAPNATDLGGNTASGNGRSPQCVGVVCP